MTGPEEIAALQSLLSLATKTDAWLRAHPGVVSFANRVLGILIKMRVSWAIDLRILLEDAPSALAEAEAHVPQAIFLLKEIQPAGTGIVGDGRSTMWQSPK